MVRQDVELMTLKDIPEMFDSQVHGKKFTSERAITCFGGLQFLRKKYKCSLLAVKHLLQDSSGSSAGGVSHETGGGCRLRIEKQGCIGQGFFNVGKSRRSFCVPWNC